MGRVGGRGEAFIVERVDRSVDRSIAQSGGRSVALSIAPCLAVFVVLVLNRQEVCADDGGVAANLFA